MPHPKAPINTDTVISKGIVATGSLQGEGTIRIEGHLEGEISLNGSVIVTATGEVKGPISANIVHVAGYVKGNITAHKQLLLEPTGYIEGDISTASLIVEDGGRFDGRSTMLQNVPPATAPQDSLEDTEPQ